MNIQEKKLRSTFVGYDTVVIPSCFSNVWLALICLRNSFFSSLVLLTLLVLSMPLSIALPCICSPVRTNCKIGSYRRFRLSEDLFIYFFYRLNFSAPTLKQYMWNHYFQSNVKINLFFTLRDMNMSFPSAEWAASNHKSRHFHSLPSKFKFARSVRG